MLDNQFNFEATNIYLGGELCKVMLSNVSVDGVDKAVVTDGYPGGPYLGASNNPRVTLKPRVNGVLTIHVWARSYNFPIIADPTGRYIIELLIKWAGVENYKKVYRAVTEAVTAFSFSLNCPERESKKFCEDLHRYMRKRLAERTNFWDWTIFTHLRDHFF